MQTLWLIFNVVLVNILLSGDNALAISLAASRLPDRLRHRAVAWGTTLAILALMVFTTLGSLVIRWPVLKTLGGLLLVGIAVKLAAEHLGGHHEEAAAVEAPGTFSKALATIVLADLSMELDNAMAMLGAAGGRIAVLLAGFAFTLPFLLFGSRLIGKVFDKLPWIIYPAAAYISFIGGQLVSEDVIYDGTPMDEVLEWLGPVAAMALFVLALATLGLIRRKHHRAEAFPRETGHVTPPGA